jgi:hypothetical protein
MSRVGPLATRLARRILDEASLCSGRQAGSYRRGRLSGDRDWHQHHRTAGPVRRNRAGRSASREQQVGIHVVATCDDRYRSADSKVSATIRASRPPTTTAAFDCPDPSNALSSYSQHLRSCSSAASRTRSSCQHNVRKSPTITQPRPDGPRRKDAVSARARVNDSPVCRGDTTGFSR